MLAIQTEREAMPEELRILKQAIHDLWVAISKEPSNSDGVLIRGLATLYPALEDFDGLPVEAWKELHESDISFAKEVVEVCRT